MSFSFGFFEEQATGAEGGVGSAAAPLAANPPFSAQGQGQGQGQGHGQDHGQEQHGQGLQDGSGGGGHGSGSDRQWLPAEDVTSAGLAAAEKDMAMTPSNGQILLQSPRARRWHAFTVHESLKLEAVQDEGEAMVHAKDVEPGLYEGGLKLWECTLDLLRFMSTNTEQWVAPGKLVLDLGCGQGLLGCWALQKGCNVDFQDLNREVLEKQTLANAARNAGRSPRDLVDAGAVRLLAGDWRSFLAQHTHGSSLLRAVDLVVSSETVYSDEMYPALHEVLIRVLRPDRQSVALLAAKRFYFGVGGGSESFARFCSARGQLHCERVHAVSDGRSNVRDILKISRQI
ncbi:Histidine protein methyltransferase 1-like [Hondaea fermentalgiana]|uniref:protein-histidine N-methyltransferase n=1 Tax=Hondaea fermentalgiana TaxID=2315210 RepID=A0A2R5GG30_9STRA|nr:Histidine protein methyltransferase 1-like [Hondaea fermentalgiana]|eukprot:GBG27603.1 Histidine protein methyltransferase 1-like [Hondaea fermentalgiana]